MRSAAPPRLHLGRRQRRDHRPRTARQRGAAHCRPSPPRQPQPRADAQRRLARAPRPARRPHQRATARTVLGPLDRPQGRLRRAAPRLMETPTDTRDFTCGFTVDQAPDMVFAAICNVRGWWSDDINGNADRDGDQFVQLVRDLHRCEIGIKQMVGDRAGAESVYKEEGTGRKIVWCVCHIHFSLARSATQGTGTAYASGITTSGDRTGLCFPRLRLVPAYSCDDVCRDGWSTSIARLSYLGATGEGRP